MVSATAMIKHNKYNVLSIPAGALLLGLLLHAGNLSAQETPLERLSPLTAEQAHTSDKENIRLEIHHPLYFETRSQQLRLSPVEGLIGLSSALGWQVDETLDMALSLNTANMAGGQFHALGDIHCENGVLQPGAYSATNCQFISDHPGSHQLSDHILSLGPSWRPSEQVSINLNYFQQEVRGDISGHPESLQEFSTLNASALSPQVTNPFAIQPLQQLTRGQLLDTRTEGINLDLKLGFTTDSSGDIQLGLSVARVTDADINLFQLSSGNTAQWSPVSPFNTAKLDLGWSKGSFSAGIQSFYRDQVDFVSRQPLEAQTTFDVHFTWRTPWNANLSIGASNALDAGTDNNEDQNQEDPFEAIYGRVPYVRYQQDL